MKNLFFVFLLFVSSKCYPQPFQTTISAIGTDNAKIVWNNDAFYLSEGWLGFFSTGVHISKLDSTGNVLWSKLYEGGFNCADAIGSGSLAVYSTIDSFTCWPAYTEMCELTVFDSTGIPQSSVIVPESLQVETMHPTGDGGTIAVVKQLSHYSTSVIFKTDSTGQFEWMKYIDDDSLSQLPVSVIDIAEVNNSGYVAAASYIYPDTGGWSPKLMLIRLNNLGDTIWTRSYTSYNGYQGCLITTPQNDLLFCSYGKIFLFDSMGFFKWGKSIPNFYDLKDVSLSSDSGFIIGGSMGNPVLLKLDSTGNMVWMHAYQTMTDFEGNLLSLHDNGFAFAASDANNIHEITLIRTDTSGASTCDNLMTNPVLTPVILQPDTIYYGISPTNTNFVHYQALYQPYLSDTTYTIYHHCLQIGEKENDNSIHLSLIPNPATTIFKASCLQGKDFSNRNSMKLVIFNTLGEKIYTADYHEPITVNCERFTPGIYFVRLSDSEKQLTQKLVIE